MKKLVVEALLILAIAAIPAFLSTVICGSKSQAGATKRAHADSDEASVSIEAAHDMWRIGNGVFLDARMPIDFEAAHIANAINLPYSEFDQKFSQISTMLTPSTSIVAYCDGAECDLSQRLKDKLEELGYRNAHILENGLTKWRMAGLPIQSSELK